MDKPTINGVYAITTTRYLDLDDLVKRTELVIKGGAKVIQFRNKTDSEQIVIEHASAIGQLCKTYKVPFILNDHLQLVHKVGAAGVHLGQHDAELSEARKILGDEALIGVSCYDSMRRAVQAQEHGADYVAIGAVYPSTTKPHASRAPLELIKGAAQILSIPIVAIGGINANNAARVITAGADALAVVSSVFDAADPQLATVRIAKNFDSDQPQETSE